MVTRNSTLEELLRPESEELEVGGNRPLRLDVNDRVWLILAGTVEIFAVRTRDGDDGAGGEGEGARTHLTTAEAGELLLSIDACNRQTPFGRRVPAPKAPATLLAVAHPGTRLLETSASALTRLAREPRHMSLLEVPIESWVSGLFRRIPRKEAPNRFSQLRPGEQVRLSEEGLNARTAHGVVWVRHVEGRSHFLGREELSLEPANFLFPISEETWLVSTGESLLSCVATGHLLRSGTIWEGLRHFYELFLRYVELQVAAGKREEQQRLARRLELDERTLQSAYTHLASVLEPSSSLPLSESGRPWVSTSTGAARNPLFAACRLVGRHQGLDLSPPRESVTAGIDGWIRRISDVSRVRYRRVLLRDDWWRRDNGPLLAFVEEDAAESPGSDSPKQPRSQRPVALLPTSPTSYEMADPVGQTRVPVDAGVAQNLAGDAYMFYLPLPERPVGPGDLLRLAFHGRRGDLLAVLSMGLGGGLLSVLVPIVTEKLYGQVIPGADRSQLFQLASALVAAALGAAAFQVTRSIAVLRITGKIDGSVQAAVWDRLLSLPISFFRRFTVGDLAKRVMGIDAIRSLLLGNVTTSFLGLAFSSFSFALLFYYSVKLALLASAMIASLIAATTVLAYFQLRHQRELLRIQGQIASLVFGLIHGIAKLRTGGAEKRAYSLWAGHFAAQRQRAFRSQRLANVQTVVNAVYGSATSLALFAMMGLAMEGGLSVSRFLAFSTAFGQVQAAALSFVSLLSGLLSIVPIYERLSPLLKATPEVDGTKTDAGELSGDIEFSHVSFRYHDESPLVVSKVSFRARPGEFIALVGPSGSGKSTSLRLLLGFEQPISGSIYYDGQDLASLDLQAVRRQIGVVLQNSRPMAGDIYTNIVGNSNLGIERAWEAARMAGLEEDIRAMPMGMHTIISEGGGTFSGGQLQRLMIARAIVNLPRLVFFDEATSALDNRTQDVVSRSLESLKATRVVVAHRLSTIRSADRIYVFESGRIVDEGTYEELAARDGLFARLAKWQTA